MTTQTTLIGRLRQAAEANRNEEWMALAELLDEAADEIEKMQHDIELLIENQTAELNPCANQIPRNRCLSAS